MTVSIRSYQPRDRSDVLGLISATLDEYGFTSPENRAGVQRDLEADGACYRGDRAGFWIAEVDGVLAGTTAIREKDAHTCELKRLYVAASARGRGVGQALFAHAQTFARAANYRKIWLDSSRRFVQARRLYERNGFVLVEECDNAWEDNVYEKSLA